jgi:hypothetical protein
MSQIVADEDEEGDEAFLRKLVLPQEDCMRLGVSWTGGYRWFRSPNVVCLEHYRRRNGGTPPIKWGKSPIKWGT